jgi:hypothetical protein
MQSRNANVQSSSGGGERRTVLAVAIHGCQSGLDPLWNELYYHDAETQRLALSRMCIAPVEARRSLELGRPVDLSGCDPPQLGPRVKRPGSAAPDHGPDTERTP